MRAPLTTSISLLLTLSGFSQTVISKSPPTGIEIPQKDREELVAAAKTLQAEIASLSKPGALPPNLQELLVDVEIFSKAVLWAAELDEFYNLKEIPAARKLLQEGTARLAALKAGEAPWTKAKGAVVRGYRSKIDGSVQPYGLYIAEDSPASGGRLDIWLHGRNDNLTELSFINGRLASKGDFTPAKTIVLHPYGRFCNGFKFAGETDVLEVTEEIIRQYHIDRDHVAIRGFSMGGAGTWHLGAHHANRWSVIAPGAGFVETAEYAKVFDAGKTPPPWWEQVLWRLYDVPGYAMNLTNRPTIAYSGEIDPQKRAADKMVEALAKVGAEIPHLIGPNTAHKYHPETKLKLIELVDAAAEKGRPLAPENVRLQTYTLRYNTMDWVRINELTRHWEHASVEASKKGPGQIELKTKGIQALSLTPPKNWADSATWSLVINGQNLTAKASPTGLHLREQNGKWITTATAEEGSSALRKQSGLQGPIDDAFTDSFVFVRPTGHSSHPKVEAWAKAELEMAITKWRINFRGDARVIDDVQVTPELMASANLVLWGDAESNSVIADLLPKLPFQWNKQQLALGGATYDANTHAPILIYPNPKAPSRYVVLNSSYTFRQGSNGTNALQTPKLPDWAVVDIQTPPNESWPGLIPDAGFFDEQWQLPKR